MKITETISEQIASFIKIITKRRNYIFYISILFIGMGILLCADQLPKPYTFKEGDIISASQMNANFDVLYNRTLGSLNDVTTSGATNGQVLKFTGAGWAPGTDEAGSSGTCKWSDGTGGIYYNSGNVGIGTTSPAGELHVNNTDSSVNLYLTSGHDTNLNLSSGKASWSYINFGGENNNNTGSIMFSHKSGFMEIDVNSTLAMKIAGNGNVGIGTSNPSYLLKVNGDAGKPGGGSWSDSSDYRLKTNIRYLNGQNALGKLCQIQGVTYSWINPQEHVYGTRAGIIAQDLEAIFPEWVQEIEPTGTDRDLIPVEQKVKAISFPHDFNAYLIEAIKELKKQNDELKAENAVLEKRLSAIERKLGT